MAGGWWSAGQPACEACGHAKKPASLPVDLHALAVPAPQQLLANNQCSPQAAAAVDALVEATGLGRSDALCLLSEPAFASRAGASQPGCAAWLVNLSNTRIPSAGMATAFVPVQCARLADVFTVPTQCCSHVASSCSGHGAGLRPGAWPGGARLLAEAALQLGGGRRVSSLPYLGAMPACGALLLAVVWGLLAACIRVSLGAWIWELVLMEMYLEPGLHFVPIRHAACATGCAPAGVPKLPWPWAGLSLRRWFLLHCIKKRSQCHCRPI